MQNKHLKMECDYCKCASDNKKLLPVVVHDRVQAVCNSKNSAVVKLGANGGLDQVVCLKIYSRCRLIQNKDPGFSEERSCQTQQLPLTKTANKVINF